MAKIKIEPVSVAFNTTANAVEFQVSTLTLSPTTFDLNAKFYNEIEHLSFEVSNVPFSLPLEDYNTWDSDVELENKCLAYLNLTRA